MNKYNKASKAFKKLRFSASTKDVDIGKAFIEIVNVEDLVNEMREMLENTLHNEDLSDDSYIKIKSLLKRARGEHE